MIKKKKVIITYDKGPKEKKTLEFGFTYKDTENGLEKLGKALVRLGLSIDSIKAILIFEGE